MQEPVTQYPPTTPYPLTFNVDYPDRPLNRLTTGLRFLRNALLLITDEHPPFSLS
jgi:hypothetical protein